MCAHSNACMHACMHAYIHTYIQTYIHTYILRTYVISKHTYIHTNTDIHYNDTYISVNCISSMAAIFYGTSGPIVVINNTFTAICSYVRIMPKYAILYIIYNIGNVILSIQYKQYPYYFINHNGYPLHNNCSLPACRAGLYR